MTAGPDHEGYPVPADWTGPVDVEFDGVRVFSVDPTRGRPAGAPARDRRREWPKALRPYLTGSPEELGSLGFKDAYDTSSTPPKVVNLPQNNP